MSRDGVVAKMQQKRLHESEVFLNTNMSN